MEAGTQAQRQLQFGDVVFAAFLIAYGLVSLSLIPSDFTDLCYLFSLEQGRWVTQEWVHPIWVPLLGLLRDGLGLLGYHGRMLVPVEVFNVAVSMTAFAVLYRFARRFPGSSLAAAAALGVTAFCPGFWSAAVRPTPYAATLLCQALSLSLLVSERPASPRRYAGAGALAGLAMGLHASAMALAVVAVVCVLCDPDTARTRRTAVIRMVSFVGAMLAVAAACWATFLLYYGIGVSYFGRQDFHSTFAGIEQTPRTSIYTSQSMAEQLRTFADTLSSQGGVLLQRAAALLVLALLVRLWARAPVTPRERRLAIAAVANFVAFAAFFVINGTRNGLIFASLTLVPVLLAVAMRGSWIAVAALLLLTVPDTAHVVTYALRNDAHGAGDPLLGEVRFLQSTLGAHDVLLTPGSPFPEMFYLSHLNILEVSADLSTHPGNEVPVVHPGAVLRARVAWWLAHGSRVLYALGDGSTDFKGDFTGAEKGRQIFWRPETTAAERAPKLEALRSALAAAGLDLRDGPTSPGGERYAEIRLREAGPPVVPLPTALPMARSRELRSFFRNVAVDGDPSLFARRVEFLAALETAIPDDPWSACDVMDLICARRPRRDGTVVPCQPVAGCDVTATPAQAIRGAGGDAMRPGGAGRCVWAPDADRQAIDDYLGEWARTHHLGRVADWGFTANGGSAELVLVLSGAKLALNWRLLDSCAAGQIDAQPSDGTVSDVVSADQLHGLVEGLPVSKVRAGGGPDHT